MVAVVDPAVAPKNSPSAICGLALEPLHQGGGIETMWFGPGRHVIGSSADCSHSLRNDGVQPRHCEIRIEADTSRCGGSIFAPGSITVPSGRPSFAPATV